MKPAPWKFLVGALLLMMAGGGVTYWIQSAKLQAEFAARVPVRPVGMGTLQEEVVRLEQRILQGDASAVAELGVLYRQAGHPAEAMACLVTMIDLEPGNPQWLLAAVGVGVELGETREAKVRLARARQLGLSEGESYWKAGMLAEALGEQVDAKSDYERAVELDPTLAAVWMRLITLYRAIGDTGAARRGLESALAANPDSALLLMDRGRQFREREQWAQALADFQRVVELQPDESGALYATAQALFQLDRKAAGEMVLHELLANDPNDRTALTLLCLEAIKAGDRAGADGWLARLNALAEFPVRDRDRIRAFYQGEFGESLPESP